MAPSLDPSSNTSPFPGDSSPLPPPPETKPFSSFPDIPPFPADVPTCPLVRISLARLLHGDQDEEDALWRACCDLGFFYIDLRAEEIEDDDDDDDGDEAVVFRGGGGAGGAVRRSSRQVEVHVDGEQLLEDADTLFEVQKGFFELPVEEKEKYDFSEQGSYFGYKGYGAGIIDKDGTKDRNEFYNTSKDDILGRSASPLPAPAMLRPHRPVLSSFMRGSHSLVNLVLRILDARLGLPAGTLPALHRLTAPSCDQVRFVRAPPQPRDDARVALGEHTDFGSVTVLFNRVGGLQVLLPPGMEPVAAAEGDDPGGVPMVDREERRDSANAVTVGSTSSTTTTTGKQPAKETWAFVRPLPGHAIVNLGDALVKMTSGILRSNIHRVAPPPGAQADCTRYSLVYFARPEDDVVLRVLEGSERIEEKFRIMRVLVTFHFNKPVCGRLHWQTDVLEVSTEGSYEDFMAHILRLQTDLSRFLGEDWTTVYPFHILWLSHDHHGKLKDTSAGVPPFQSHLRKSNWKQVLRMMEQRDCRDIIIIEVEDIKKRAGKPGWEVETDTMVEWEAKGRRVRKSRTGQLSMGVKVEDSDYQPDSRNRGGRTWGDSTTVAGNYLTQTGQNSLAQTEEDSLMTQTGEY
ncbi:putative oxoglutarate iron-dependent oxygenase [Diplodia seriata]|uniref:Putative oxoglutarate iron-dependent oxygenase n=1 Tax=Diplodia seriata TaxID=420778 RepID=A0A0G2GS02_9PEZI|nr:putative oxoglutarate iron-dependent oxygenase [Diplodia seriata]